MKKDKILLELIFLARKFSKTPSLSIYALLKKAGYFENYNRISVKDIQGSLIQNRECVNDWLQYSDDKRTTSGWYYKIIDKNSFKVGYIKDGNDNVIGVYTDPTEACSLFIKHEIDEIKDSGSVSDFV